MIDQATIQRVFDAADIVDVVSDYVTLQRRGVNYIGLCPFHNEKTPSFTVSSEKQIFKCFGCGVGGDAISFVSKIENLDYKESLEFLAEKGNIDLSRYIVSSSGNIIAESKDEKERLYTLNKCAAKYFFEALNEECNKKENSMLFNYLNKRQLDKKTIIRFGLGFGSKPRTKTYRLLKI
jgi:DNA primase